MFNLVINNISQKKMLFFCLMGIAMYFGINFVEGNLLFPSVIIQYIVIYFTVAYIKIYLNELLGRKTGLCMFIAGILGNYILVFITNIVGLKVQLLSEQLFFWKQGGNPLLLMAAIGLLGVGLNWNIQNEVINYISSLTMLVYIIHENILIRNFLRPLGFIYIYNVFGYNQLLWWVLLYSIIFFGLACVLGVVYKSTIGRVTSVYSKNLQVRWNMELGRCWIKLYRSREPLYEIVGR